MRDLKDYDDKLFYEFNLPVGLSDSNINPIIAISAVSLGANIIEKHLKIYKPITRRYSCIR